MVSGASSSSSAVICTSVAFDITAFARPDRHREHLRAVAVDAPLAAGGAISY
jgi:hypothetical protein